VSRLAEELAKLSQAGGIAATLHTDAATVPSSASLVIETQAGDESHKRELLKKLDAKVSGSTVIVSSCLAFSPTRIASWSAAPERVVGFATFYPLADKKVVELSGGLRTGDDSLEQAEEFFRRLGKETARVKDTAGLIFPRILSLIINEAARALERLAEIDRSACRQRVQQCFSSTTMVEAYERVYSTIFDQEAKRQS
jgi:3-hydroxybutyryl-CoA dehydrogenase